MEGSGDTWPESRALPILRNIAADESRTSGLQLRGSCTAADQSLPKACSSLLDAAALWLHFVTRDASRRWNRMRLAATLLAIAVLSACSSSSSVSSASRSPSPSASPTVTAGPDCASVTTARALALYAYNPVLDVLDVTNPVQPKLLCFIPNASGGRFLSATTVALWNASTAEVMDLTTSKVLRSQKLSAAPYEGTFTADTAVFAYRVATSDGTETMHLLDMTSGSDRLLYTQAPMGGHGGVPGGPRYQLRFSPDGKELLDFDTFRPQSGPASLLVFRPDGSILF
jgi:hypothetical protein